MLIGLTVAWYGCALAEASGTLPSDQVLVIGAGTLGLAAAGNLALKSSPGRQEIGGAWPLETRLQHLFAGACTYRKSNFLDHRWGGAVAPAAFGLLLIAVDYGWAKPGRGGNVQDLFLYSSGLLATSGITAVGKGMLPRRRPYVDLCGNNGYGDSSSSQVNARRSFFSGHASTAFFAATYLNKRTRQTMREQLTAKDYGNWSWAPPTLLYALSTFVGYSRIAAYKHYPSDVIAGALTGYLLAELYFSFNSASGESDAPVSSVVTLTIRF